MSTLRWLLPLALLGCSPVISVGEQLTVQSRSCGGVEAYERSRAREGGSCIFWSDTRDLTWHLDERGTSRIPSAIDAIARAFGHWQAAGLTCSDWRFHTGSLTTNAHVEVDGTTHVLFREQNCRDVAAANDPCWDDLSCADVYSCWEHHPGTVAITTTTYNVNTGHISDVDFEFNAADFFFTTVDSPACGATPSPSCVSMDLEGAMTHEIGHALGLSHVLSTTAFSTLTPSVRPGELSLRVVDASSACALCDIYPAAEASRDCQ